ncbi:hypothetical protein C8Q77DRAFT_1151869 [Trametes polyzona]|nr:hypothetical protein C8Q77DRAFT_1151869 [Trametes polyzona]
MQFLSALSLLLAACGVSRTSARSLSGVPHRRQANPDALGGVVCNNARVVTNSTVTWGSATVELSKVSCAPIVKAHDSLLPAAGPDTLISPLDPLARTTTTRTITRTRTATTTPTVTTTAVRTSTATATATATVTEVDTATVTAVSLTTETATATETDVETETATETATEVTTSATTVILSTTDTETATATVTTPTTVIESFTETDTATDTEVVTTPTTVISSVTDTATLVLTATVTAAAPTPTLANVCSEACTTACGQPSGLLNFAPSNEDCARLVDTLTGSLSTGTSPFIDIEPSHVFTATHGTCKFTFANFGPTTLETCVLSVVRAASAALSGCLESAQPAPVTEGFCLATSGVWEVSVTRA